MTRGREGLRGGSRGQRRAAEWYSTKTYTQEEDTGGTQEAVGGQWNLEDLIKGVLIY